MITLRPPALVLTLFTLLAGCGGDGGVALEGSTMGTRYHVRAFCTRGADGLGQRIDAALAEIDAEMSTWNAESALSRFNRGPVGEWISVPRGLATVLSAAHTLALRSDGAFDVTVAPLVDAWGFGADEAARTGPPDPAILAAARARIGYQFLDVRAQPPALRRRRDLAIDVAAIAPGYAVDVLSTLLVEAGCPDHMIEIGGEVFARGRKGDGSAWRIGIETPDPEQAPGTSVTRVVRLSDMAVATSGDYRDFVEWNGVRYSHTFDPRSGTPVTHSLASVTVLDRSTMWADGYATLLNVLGPSAGVAFAEAAGIPALFIERREAGFVETSTAAFEDYLDTGDL
jgi:thiamine biosynthesis lipoprotein